MDATKIQMLMKQIRYNYEGALTDATFAACVRGCKNGARGGGICPACATEDLAELIGEDLASQYRAACENLLQASEAIFAKIRGK